MDNVNKVVSRYATELLSDNEFKEFISSKSYQRVINGMPGIGKTSLIQALSGIKILAVPTRALAIQLIAEGCIGVMGDSGGSDEYPLDNIKGLKNGDEETIVTTFDMTPQVAEYLALKFIKFELIVDEFHCIAGEASYRMPACSKLYELIKLRKSILISGTVNTDTLETMEGFSQPIKHLDLNKANQQRLEVEWYRVGKRTELDHIAHFIDCLPEGKSAIVFINCEKSIEAMQRKCKDMGIRSLVYTKTTQDSKPCKTFLESGDASPYQVIFCTSALVQGVSITTPIDYAFIVDNYYGTPPDKIVQFIYRMRKNTPRVIHVRKNLERRVDLTVDGITRRVEIERQLEDSHRDLMKKKSHDRNGVDKEFLEIVDRHDILMNSACDNSSLAEILFNQFGVDYKEIEVSPPPKTEYKKNQLNWREAMQQFDEIYAPTDLGNPIFDENIVKFMHRAIKTLREVCESRDEIKKVFESGRGAVVRELLHVSSAFDQLRQSISMSELKTGEEYSQAVITKEVTESMKRVISDVVNAMDGIVFDEVYEIFQELDFKQMKQLLVLKRVQNGGVRYRYEGIMPANFVCLGDGGRYIENITCIPNIKEPWNAFIVKLDDALEMIKEGDEKTEKYQEHLFNGDFDSAKKLKDTLHGFVFNSGKEWADGRRVWHEGIEYTGIIVLDVDVEKEEGRERQNDLKNVEKLFKRLKKDHRILFMFRSVSGGLKIGVKTNYNSSHDTADKEKKAYEQVWAYVHDTFYKTVSDCRLKIDESCKDHLRVTYMSHDSKLFVRHQFETRCLDVSACMVLKPESAKLDEAGIRKASFVDDRDYYSIIEGAISKLSAAELDRTCRWGLIHGIKFLCNGEQGLLNMLQAKCSWDTSNWPVDVFNQLAWVPDEEAKRALFGQLKRFNIKTGSGGVGQKRSLYAGMSNPGSAKMRVSRMKKQEEYKEWTTEQLLELPDFDDLRS